MEKKMETTTLLGLYRGYIWIMEKKKNYYLGLTPKLLLCFLSYFFSSLLLSAAGMSTTLHTTLR